MHDHTDDTQVTDGPGLARGPALVLGAILSGFGLAMFLKNGATPSGGFSGGDVEGSHLLGIETNGWTAFATTTAGVLLLFGAAHHLLAKTMSLLVGLALAACAVIALIDGHDVLGLAAANGWTELGWAIAAALLLVNTLMPRVRRRDRTLAAHDARVVGRPATGTGAVAPAEPAAGMREPATRRTSGEDIVDRDRAMGGSVRSDRTTRR